MLLTILEAGKSKIKVLVCLMSGEGWCLFGGYVFWRGRKLCSYMVEMQKRTDPLHQAFYKLLISSQGLCPALGPHNSIWVVSTLPGAQLWSWGRRASF
jgi:hypothetical protein